MTWVFAILLVLLLGGIAFVAAGRGAPLAEEHGDRPDAGVPATGRLSGADLRRVRFPLAFRGYRMSDVDALLDRLATEREHEEHQAPPSPPVEPPEPTEQPQPTEPPTADASEDPSATPRGPEPAA